MYHSVDGYIFERNDKDMVTYTEAEELCQAKGGHLASITSDAQVAAIAGLVPDG